MLPAQPQPGSGLELYLQEALGLRERSKMRTALLFRGVRQRPTLKHALRGISVIKGHHALLPRDTTVPEPGLAICVSEGNWEDFRVSSTFKTLKMFNFYKAEKYPSGLSFHELHEFSSSVL